MRRCLRARTVLINSSHAGGRIKMPDVGLNRADGAKAILLREITEGFSQGENFDGIPTGVPEPWAST